MIDLLFTIFGLVFMPLATTYMFATGQVAGGVVGVILTIALVVRLIDHITEMKHAK